ncbi:restriction endonuclease subunit S [Finegoldia magna]|uniref:Type I restriction modification DNA specificity domain-containing protein n=1 Tax=Finegoldia magna TaxID=1260 RepID=A0A233VPG9_FINMA|nr:restriction endonuclease subunit S [Finegoldia magna]OXZ34247.1 hypothetical protein B9N55_01550 [Finegoldia magna]
MEFKKVKLGEILKYKNGKKKPVQKGEFPVYGGNGIFDYSSDFNNENSIIIGRVGAYCGSVYYCKDKCWISDNAISATIKDKDNNDIKFFYYFLYDMDLNQLRIGTSQPLLNQDILKNIDAVVFDTIIQRKISNILSNLDSKIEINNKIISNLESQAQAIFRSWFVDFEPFQDGNFVESELGMIPEGWEVKELGEIINLYDNKRVPISKMDRDKMEKNYPYYGANGIIDYVDNYLFDGKYLLMGEDGTVRTEEGFPILNYVDEKFWVSNHAHIMRGTLVSTEYIYLLLSKMFINNIVTGAVQEKINQRNLKGIKIIFPEKKELERFEKIIEPMFKMKLYLNNQNTKLAEMRDALLPKLMAGEIDVSNIKIEGEEVKNE